MKVQLAALIKLAAAVVLSDLILIPAHRQRFARAAKENAV